MPFRVGASIPLVHALLQAFMLKHQRITHHHPHHAGVAFTKLQQQRDDAAGLAQPYFCRLVGGRHVTPGDLLHEREHGLLDEVDEPLEHLRLAGEMAVQRRFTHRQTRGQCGRSDALGAGLFQHGRQRLQDLHAPLARLGPLAGRWRFFSVNGVGRFNQRRGIRHAQTTKRKTHRPSRRSPGLVECDR